MDKKKVQSSRPRERRQNRPILGECQRRFAGFRNAFLTLGKLDIEE